MNTDPKDRDCDCVLELMSVDGAFTCTIKKYSMIVQPYFYTPPFDAAGERWKLQCYPRGCGGENQGYCGWHVLSNLILLVVLLTFLFWFAGTYITWVLKIDLRLLMEWN